MRDERDRFRSILLIAGALLAVALLLAALTPTGPTSVAGPSDGSATPPPVARSSPTATLAASGAAEATGMGSGSSGDATAGSVTSGDGAGTDVSGGPAPSASVTATGATGTALALLARLPLRAEHGAGYARSLFRLWIDADGDGCDTRREVLIAESRTTVRLGASCWISGGSWRSAYDGVTTSDPSTFDIDHVVPLKEAWDSGAWDWTAARRGAYANDLGDPRSLRAVSATSNRTKSDRDPADWLPMRAFRCTYAEDWVAIKVRWKLALDEAERSALAGILGGCSARTLRVAIVSGGEHGGATTSSGSTGGATGTASGCNPNYTGWCVPNSPTDLDCPDIGHRVTVVGVDVYRFDSDGDGIGCDSYPAG